MFFRVMLLVWQFMLDLVAVIRMTDKANALCERFIGSVRREWLVYLLSLSSVEILSIL